MEAGNGRIEGFWRLILAAWLGLHVEFDAFQIDMPGGGTLHCFNQETKDDVSKADSGTLTQVNNSK